MYVNHDTLTYWNTFAIPGFKVDLDDPKAFFSAISAINNLQEDSFAFYHMLLPLLILQYVDNHGHSSFYMYVHS